MKISWKNIENWRSWKMRFFWDGHFEFLSRPFWIFFLLHFIEKSSPFLWGIFFFCTMDGFSRILENKLSELLCTRLYHPSCQLGLKLTLQGRQLNTKYVVKKLIFAADTIGYYYDKSNLGWPHCTHCEPVWHKTSTAALSLTLALL